MTDLTPAVPAPRVTTHRVLPIDPRVRSGMRAAGAFLLGTAAVQILVIVFGLTPAITLPVDIVVGIQLLLERPAWRPWALVRGWAGLPLAVMLLVSAGSSMSVWLGVGVDLAYLIALALLLTGTPSSHRLRYGRAAAVLAAGVLLAAIVCSVLFRHAAGA